MGIYLQEKKLTTPEEMVAEFVSLSKLLKTCNGNVAPIHQEMNIIANNLILITKNTYDKTCIKYQELRNYLHDKDRRSWENLEKHINTYLKKSPKEIKLLDVGTGPGRDIIYAHKQGYKITGVDNSDGVINILERLNREKLIPDGSYYKNDMRKLQFEDGSFDVVRHNASLIHLPIISYGYTVDQAISEAKRVLVDRGLLYVSVKKGNSLRFADTGEGLGGRIFQYYTQRMIKALLQRHDFTIIFTIVEPSTRSKNEKWISVIAQKNSIL